MKKKRRIIIITFLAIIFASLSFFVVKYIKNEQRKVTAEEWIVKKYELIDQLSAFSSGLDDVVSLYSVGSISAQDLSNEIYIAKTQLAIMEKLYDQELEEHPIKTGTHTVETKCGMDGLDLIWGAYEELLDQMDQVCEASGSANDIAYIYLAYREPITTGLFEYMHAYYSITDPSKLEELETSKSDSENITEAISETEHAGSEQPAS